MAKTVRHIEKKIMEPLSPLLRDQELTNLIDAIEAKRGCEDKLAALKEAEKVQKANLETLEDQIKEAQYKIKHGVLTEVPCKMILDWDNKVIDIFRKDTYEIVETREMTEKDTPQLTDEEYEEINK